MGKKIRCRNSRTVMTRESDTIFRNRMYFVTPDGVVRHYDKCHLFEYSGEDKVYTPGDKRLYGSGAGCAYAL